MPLVAFIVDGFSLLETMHCIMIYNCVLYSAQHSTCRHTSGYGHNVTMFVVWHGYRVWVYRYMMICMSITATRAVTSGVQGGEGGVKKSCSLLKEGEIAFGDLRLVVPAW